MRSSRRRRFTRATAHGGWRTWITCASLVVAAALSPPAVAWEEDIHYGLTFWLGTRAGFSRQDADIIARATQSYDDSEHAAAISTVLWIILSEDEGAARELQRKHFPTDAPFPSPPIRRAVAPNSPSARRAAEAALAPSNSAIALVELGEALHPFQDSWSHQGVPDIPFNLRPNMISAHPAARGGWRSHDADLTHLHVTDTLEMARETYALLTTYLTRNPSRRERPSEPWDKLAPIVRELAVAANTAAKDAWAVANIPEQRAGLSAMTNSSSQTLGVRVLAPPRSTQRTLPGQHLSASEMGRLLAEAQAFLAKWLERRDIGGALEHVAVERLAAQLAGSSAVAPSAREWCEKVLTMYLIDDHTAVSGVGHGDPTRAGYAQLPRAPQRDGPFRATRSGGAVPLLATDFVPTDVSGSPGYALVLTLNRLTHDTVCIVWESIAGRWSITRLLPMVH
jgi:hypothetical protein